MSICKISLLTGLKLTLCALALSPGNTLANESKTTIFVNGHVYTPKGWSETIAVKEGRIVAVGDDANARRNQPKDATVIDLGGKTVFPGLYDMHVHPLEAGMAQSACNFDQRATPEQMLARVAECARGKKPGEWITGGQWQGISFGKSPPNRAMLDKVAPNNPVMLADVSGHAAWINTAAMNIAKVTRDTPDPRGGIIERDEQGEPTGVFRETARMPIRAAIPAPSLQAREAALKLALNQLQALGVTGITDAALNQSVLDAYQQLSTHGDLKMHVRGCLVFGGGWNSSEQFERLMASRTSFTQPMFKMDCMKVFVDGVPTEGHTAAMIDPYAPGEDGKVKEPARGLLIVPPSVLNPIVTRMDKDGVVVKFHAVGDLAIRTAMDAIAAARAANGPNGPTHDVGHLTFLTHSDAIRAKSLHATLEFSPYLWFPAIINEDIEKAIGPARIEHIWPVKDGLASGALVVVGSDWPTGTPSNNPWVGLETLVTRRAPGASANEQSFGPLEAIDLKSAVDMFTINAARQMGEGNKRGSIEVGKMADLIILDRNPFEIPVTDIHNVTVQQVYVDGNKTYQK